MEPARVTGCKNMIGRDTKSGGGLRPEASNEKDLAVELDIYRDQALEKLLIVKRNVDIKKIPGIKPEFLNGLTRPTHVIDSDFDRLPTGLKLDEVIEAVNARGYFAATLVVTIKEVDC